MMKATFLAEEIGIAVTTSKGETSMVELSAGHLVEAQIEKLPESTDTVRRYVLTVSLLTPAEGECCCSAHSGAEADD